MTTNVQDTDETRTAADVETEPTTDASATAADQPSDGEATAGTAEPIVKPDNWSNT